MPILSYLNLMVVESSSSLSLSVVVLLVVVVVVLIGPANLWLLCLFTLLFALLLLFTLLLFTFLLFTVLFLITNGPVNSICLDCGDNIRIFPSCHTHEVVSAAWHCSVESLKSG